MNTPPLDTFTIAEKAVTQILADLTGRKGLGDEWDQIDKPIQREIRAGWAEIIEEAIIDAELDYEWARINALTPAELHAELRAAGIDPEKGVARIHETLAKLGIEAKSETT